MTSKLLKSAAIAVMFFLLFNSCEKQNISVRQTIDLSGEWQFALDSENVGIQQNWFKNNLNDVINLPSTTDLEQKGFLNSDTSFMHLNREYYYEGPAWYRKKINIPATYNQKHIELIMERTKSSMVWIDDHYIGESRLLQTPQVYNVTDFLTPGEHTITLRINNDLKLTPYGQVHIYTDETQTNWNGVIGDFKLEAKAKTFIKDLQVYPNVNDKKINVAIAVENGLQLADYDVSLKVDLTIKGKNYNLEPVTHSIAHDSLIFLHFDLARNFMLWDDYEQPMYHLTVSLSSDTLLDSKSVPFGLRSFEANGTQFTINKRTTFLRGKHDACVYPLTGHPPMDVEGWVRFYKIAKFYGINHVRFHSYCPPEAAFTAADQIGIFLQPELPFWGGLEADSVAAVLFEEGCAMLKKYANHPSFVLFGPGNEIWSGHDNVEKIMTALKKIDDRPLYTMGSNNNIGYMPPRDYCDFFVAARTPSAGDTTLTHTRLTHAFADSRDGGILNASKPSTLANFDYPVSQVNMPIISHEIGQYQIYPDFNEIEKYTGVVKAWNLEKFKDGLDEAGMLDQNSDFQKASGAWSALCYKAEMEAAFRTKGLAGFQLLDLQDYPGQGTALVGILDAFMDSKNVISREEWVQSCNDVVLLAEFEKFCWKNNETFNSKIEIANYSNQTFDNKIQWSLINEDGEILQNGELSNQSIEIGKLNDVGVINFDFDFVKKVKKLELALSLENTNYTNRYPLWVYPVSAEQETTRDILIADELNKDVLTALENGENVLLFPKEKSIAKKSVGGLFPPDFWNYGMFKKISEWNDKPISPGTLGLLTNPEHPIFKNFPTDFHTNWQWFSIVKNSRPLILDKTDGDYRPIVQVVDNLERNHKLGLIFEFSVGAGKLLVCMTYLDEMQNIPEAKQLYNSIVNYMHSTEFAPNTNIDDSLLNALF